MKHEYQHSLPFVDHLFKDATFSSCKKYRYELIRVWDWSLPLVQFIGLNPSKADAKEDDPTIKSVTRISAFNGYGGFIMSNLYAYISTDPAELIKDENVSMNDKYLKRISYECQDVVYAWGNFKVSDRAAEVMKLIPGGLCIGKNSNGSPKHPLFQKGKSVLIPFTITAE